ncbi:hypothetical protein Cpa01nite_06770 [Cellulomonas pakistanensis]|uniref:N-acetyltransferase domain-containing protein n=1 Tax=Cellulomonas pakistanensis TaxID=992287 RepID=A0A919P999_9CELL|nr:hypothetical protein Cpa01nite_06770 [Cellulomonas pakistanensis]
MVVGRTTAHRDARLDAKLGTRALLFGATEFADATAAGALFAALEARATGERELIGPVSLLPNQTGGVVTSGWAERGFVDSPWNPAHVPGVYEAAGFRRWHEADTWVADVRPVDAPTAAEWAAVGVRPEHGSRRAMGRLVPELLDLLNASFAALPYYTPITPAEMRAATDGLAWLLDERLLLLARDEDGAAVAFVLAVPDITRFLQATGGRLGPVEQLRLLATRGRYREDAVLVIQGTRPDRQGEGILTLLSRELHAGLHAGGYRRLRMTSVGRDNPASARQSERFGGRPLHGLTFYRRPVPQERA